MKSQAEEYFRRTKDTAAAAEAAELAKQTLVLCDSLDANAKARKRQLAAKALAKRTPKKMKVSSGTLLQEGE